MTFFDFATLQHHLEHQLFIAGHINNFHLIEELAELIFELCSGKP